MRFLQVMVFLVFVIVANGGKVVWDSNGKPQIEKSKKPVKGCIRGGLESLGQDNNISCKGEKR